MKYVKINITAEGQTEEQFAKRILSLFLIHSSVTVDARRVRTSKDKIKTYRGGLLDYGKAKKDIIEWMKEDRNPDVYFTTMFDLYALPTDFPRYEESKQISDPYRRVEFLEKAFSEDINDRRFIPYIQLYEFEALVLSNPSKLSIEYFDREKEINKLTELLIKNNDNSELINGNNPPSKQILKLIPEYDKVAIGSTLEAFDEMDILRERCKHFGYWLTKLENLTNK
jgi:Domain of unknown function (DUF4276)